MLQILQGAWCSLQCESWQGAISTGLWEELGADRKTVKAFKQDSKYSWTWLLERSFSSQCRARASKLWLWDKSGLPPVFVSKWCLSGTQPHSSFVYYLYCFHTAMTVLSSCTEDLWAHKAKSVHHLALYRPKKKKNADSWSIGGERRKWVQRQGDQLGVCQEPAEWGWRGQADPGDVRGVEWSGLGVLWGTGCLEWRPVSLLGDQIEVALFTEKGKLVWRQGCWLWFSTCSLWGSSGTSRASQVALMVKNLSTNAGDIRDMDSILGSGRSPGGGHSHPLQCSRLENPLDRGAWRALVLGVVKNWTLLKCLRIYAS